MRSESAVLRSLPASTEVPAPPSRADRLRALGSESFDLLVIGGGVTGAGAARDAALRGLKVALVEREDFASGTSSRSSRLIHGGLRYLEHGHLGLVFESSIERRRLLHLAPHLVRPLAFIWPVYEGARVPRWKLNAGLMLYDALSLFRNVKAYQRLSLKQLVEAEPGIRSEGLKGGARYYDAATDDARLTLANALGASEAGAVVLNHASVKRLVLEDGKVKGAVVMDHLTGLEHTVHARAVVNATGPWSDEIRQLDSSQQERTGPAVRGSKGVHIAVPRSRLNIGDALTLLSPVDGRVMFILPADAFTLIGTTETATRAHPAEVRASEADVAYLLSSANAFFPEANLTREDMVSAWAGIRPLAASGYHGNSDAGSASREHSIDVSPSGVLAISGGKLTTFRVMARDVVNAVERHLSRPHKKPVTHEQPLPGGDILKLDAELAAAKQEVGDAATGEHLVRAYGSRWHAVWALTRESPALAEPLVEGLPYRRAEAAWGVSHEMVQTLADLLIRRLKVAFETRDQGRAAAVRAAEVMAPLLGWDAAETERQLAAYAVDAQRIFGVDPSDA
ncbi:glycerol-3-phosphate dehydrogenase [Corallococcus sp. AB030]|uniref:glycerol-3-phosphate dehydrogenase n=1 Tax=unclassified Corallococcus TaxID=2685029 RepID=UPI000ED31908|nr:MULTISPECIES: glycerol-3-phosphate dehydrogenase [unclassified Corallococcus]RKI02984.1 glycerol-3-phosphate dehydrogenase [Corallococcus sp. AB030]RUO94930.1 glycerol-3-phosphate dehydrogenase [Corallococcus sp. AB018]